LSDLTDINFLDSISSNLKKLMVGLVILTQSKVMLVYVIFDMEPSRERFHSSQIPFSGSLTPVKIGS
jgi:hypothetical protein